MADSRKAALAQVVGAKVHASLASPTVEEARAEFAARRVGRDRPTVTVRGGLNHVGIRVDDLDAAIHFYAEGFGLERIAAPSFGSPVVWLRAGSLQLHLTVKTRAPQPSAGHFALEVDDFGSSLPLGRDGRCALALGRRQPRCSRLPGRRVPDVPPRSQRGTSSRSATPMPHGGVRRSPSWFVSRISIRRTPTRIGRRSFSIGERA